MSASQIPDPLHILLIEDDDVDIEAVRRSLRRAGMDKNTLHIAHDGSEALEMLRGMLMSTSIRQGWGKA